MIVALKTGNNIVENTVEAHTVGHGNKHGRAWKPDPTAKQSDIPAGRRAHRASKEQ